MGCDAHMYIEYKSKENKTFKSFGGRINPGRNYLLFGIMCEGVRTDPTFNYPAKGMPDDAGYYSNSDNQIYISDTPGENSCTMETAQKWVLSGQKFINGASGKPTWVTHPDWHSHTWLSLDEYTKVLNFYNTLKNESDWKEPEYEAILGAMQVFAAMGYETRIVLWFDN